MALCVLPIMFIRKGSLLGFLSVLHHTSLVSKSEPSISLFSSSSVLVPLSLVTTTAEDCVYTKISCGDITVTVQTFIVTLIREIRKCIHIWLTHTVALLQNIPKQCHDHNWRKTEHLNEWSLCCSLMVLKIGGQD
jgi:hypothetical protein